MRTFSRFILSKAWHMRTEIHVITFGQDLRLFELQAISIDRMFDYNNISKFRVIVNDKNYEGVAEKIKFFLDTEISLSLRRKVDIVNSAKYITQGDDGWKDQQYLKLYSVADSHADWVMVLDAKNHFVKDTLLEDFFIDNKAKTYFGHPSTGLVPWLKSSLQFFDVTDYANNAMPTVTPYMMRPDLMRRMLDEIKADSKATNKDNIFRSPALANTSEFFLYFAFLSKYSLYENCYADAPRMCETLYTTWPQDHAIVSRLLNHIRSGQYHLFGLHRKRLHQLTESEKDIIRDIWEPLKLRKDPTYYLELPE